MNMKNTELPHTEINPSAENKKEIHKKSSLSTFMEIVPERVHGEIIGKIASSFHCIDMNSKIEDIAQQLQERDSIKVIGVVNDFGEPVGAIVREDLTGTLSKPFGRELYLNKSAISVARDVPRFNFNRNILSVSEEISGSLDIELKSYYLLIDDDLKFAGAFCSDDLLMYLSEMTQRDIAMATRLQSFIVKEEDERVTQRCIMLASSKMARGVGGDYYSIRNFAEGRHLLALCDVSGKGMSASLLSVLLDGMLNIYDLNNGIEGFIKHINSYILHTFKYEKYVTGIFLDIDENNGSASIIDMGHSYCYMFRNEKFIQLKSKYAGLPIGIDGECEPRKNMFQLKKDDLVMLFSDGIEEQKNPKGEEFGLRRLGTIIRENRGIPLRHIKDRILEAIKTFRGNQTQLDDISMVFLHYLG